MLLIDSESRRVVKVGERDCVTHSGAETVKRKPVIVYGYASLKAKSDRFLCDNSGGTAVNNRP